MIRHVAAYTCAACGQCKTEYSKRQRKRAEMGSVDARCVSCVTNNTAVIRSPILSATTQSAYPATTTSTTESPTPFASNKQTSNDLTTNFKAVQNNECETATDDVECAAAVPAALGTATTASETKRTSKTTFTKNKRPCDLNDENEKGTATSDEAESGTVSLAALKEAIMGRKVVSIYDTCDDGSDPNESHLGANVCNASTPQNQISDALRQDLVCAICRDILFQPVSLLCGHSFCEACINWWLTRQLAAAPHRSESRSVHGSCPTCRQAVSSTLPASHLGINTALRACLEALLGHELKSRRQAQRKLTVGENGGAHDGGFAMVQSVEDTDWITVRGKTKRHGAISARRSIVLDEQDQRMQLSLAFKSEPNIPTVLWENDTTLFEVSLCLLMLEEDEVEEGGFPLVLDDPDDDHLIVTEVRLLGSIDVTGAKLNSIDESTRSSISSLHFRPVARCALRNDGVVHFRIDTAVFSPCSALQFCFHHQESGAELHLCLPPGRKSETYYKSHDDYSDESTHEGLEHTDHFVEEQYDDQSDELDSEDNAFIASEDDGNDDDDVCCVCRDGGEMIVCDGGHHLAGCGCYFHVACIHRSIVPPGDWVCQGCANLFGLVSVGLEGHEFDATELGTREQSSLNENSKLLETNTRKLSSRSGRLNDLHDSDSDDVGSASFSPEVNENSDSENLTEQNDGSGHNNTKPSLQRKQKDKTRRIKGRSNDSSESESEDFSLASNGPDINENLNAKDSNHLEDGKKQDTTAKPSRRKRQRIVDSDDDEAEF